jgi:predicted 3-demethylubiquinone-9 3-methyltransferase (glyoxalase superfamily)
MTEPIYPCLWFDSQAKEAAEYYCSVFKNSKMITSNPMVAVFEIEGKKFMCLNGGPNFKPTDANSYVVSCENQSEIDYYWNRLTADGGQESMCGWLKDKFGFSWQIIPYNIGNLLSRPGAVQAMLKMKKLDIAGLENA